MVDRVKDVFVGDAVSACRIVNLHQLIVIRKSCWIRTRVIRRNDHPCLVKRIERKDIMESMLSDAAGHLRSPATLPGYHQGRPPRNKGLTYPGDPPTVEEIVAGLRAAGERPDGARRRALIVILWPAGLRISEALALAETDLNRTHGAVLVWRGKGGRRREAGMDSRGWNQLDQWLQIRAELPAGRFCA
ncbi:MAG: tyrosine-type recombinase/integrase [Solirubrobacteraceae bacterium]